MSLFSVFRRGSFSAAPAAAVAQPRIPARFTPHDPGIPLVPVDDLLHEHRDLLHRIHLAYGCSDDVFNKHVVDVVRRYAEYVHLLPATTDNYFCDPGGLLRMGLEVGFMSLQASDSVIYAGRETVTHRMHLEPRWRYATFLGGLLSELHCAYSKLNVTSGDDGQDWPAYMSPLTHWCLQNGFDRYYIRWSPRPLEARGQSLFAVPYILPTVIMQYLADRNTVIVPHLLGSISRNPSHKESNPIDSVVRIAIANVIERYLVGSAERYGKAIVGSHVERYLVDAMQRLVISGAWVINGPKARLWFGADGLYLVWPNAAADIVRLLERDQLPGIPKAPDSIAEVLSDASAFDRNDSDGGHIFWIRPPDATDPIAAVRITRHLMLTSSLQDQPDPLAINLEVPAPRILPVAGSKSPAQTPSASPAKPPVSVVSPSPVGSPPVVNDDDDDDDSDSSDPITALPAPLSHALSSALAALESQPAGERPTSSSDASPQPHRADRTGPPPAIAIELLHNSKIGPEVRKAVAGYLASLCDSMALQSACISETGVLMPVREFEQRGVDKGLSVRSLHDAGIILAQANRAKALQHNIAGQNLLCVLIAPAAVRITTSDAMGVH